MAGSVGDRHMETKEPIGRLTQAIDEIRIYQASSLLASLTRDGWATKRSVIVGLSRDHKLQPA
jgi:hypothetical protein